MLWYLIYIVLIYLQSTLRRVVLSLFPNTAQSVASSQTNHSAGEKDLKASVQQLAARAASLATAEAAKNIVPPTSAYQFEVSWRGFSGDRTLQARLMKVHISVVLFYASKIAPPPPNSTFVLDKCYCFSFLRYVFNSRYSTFYPVVRCPTV